MINAMMRPYNYSTFGTNDYGQKVVDNQIKGQVKMAINLTNQSIQNDINYKDAQYVGLTMNEVSEDFVINYGTKKLKVLYINPFGRFIQVFLQEI